MKRLLSIILCILLVAISVSALTVSVSAKDVDVADAGYQIFITDYQQLKNLLNNSQNGEYLILQNDIIVEDNDNDNTLVLGPLSNCTLDLNGYTLSRTTRGVDGCLIQAKSGSVFNIVDSSNDNSGEMAFIAGNYAGTNSVILANGNIDIYGGTFEIKTPYEVGGGVVLMSETGYIEIYDGVFDSHTAYGGDTIELRHNAYFYDVPHCDVYGGTFYGKISNFEVSAYSSFLKYGCFYPSVYVYDGEFYIANPDDEYAGFAYCNNGYGQVIVAGGTVFYKCLNSSDQKFIDGVNKRLTSVNYEGKTGYYYEITPPTMIGSEDLSLTDRLSIKLMQKEFSYYSPDSTIYKDNIDAINAVMNHIDVIEVAQTTEESPLLWIENTENVKTVSWYMSDEEHYNGKNTSWSELGDFRGNVLPFRFDFRPQEKTTLYIRALITMDDGEQIEDVIAIDYEEFKPNPPVTLAKVTGIDEPSVGAYPDFTATAVGDAFNINGVFWTDVTNSSHVSLENTDTFVAGHTYELEVWLRANKDYKFNTDSDGWVDISATIGGKHAEIVPPGAENAAIIKITYALEKSQVVSFVDIGEVDAPVAGNTPDMTAYCYSNGCDIDTVEWYDITETQRVKLDAGSKFEAGRSYRVVVGVATEGNCTFYMDDGYNETEGAINGERANAFGTHDDSYMEFYYDFLPCEVSGGAILGDVDGDGVVTILDATTIQRHLAKIDTIADARLAVSDTDKDGNLTILDATQIQRLLAKLIDKL